MTLNDWLFAGACGAAIYARSVSATLFCAAYAIHSVLSPGIEQWQRYIALILIDSAAAFIVVAIRQASSASVITGVFSGAFLVVNSAGFISWYLYFPPATYDAICSVVYVAMMVAFIDEGLNGQLRLAIHRLAGSSTRVTVRKGVGLHNKDADKT